MAIYDSLRDVCQEQHNIMDNEVDLMVLSSALEALSRLAELNLYFDKTVEEWLEPYLALDNQYPE